MLDAGKKNKKQNKIYKKNNLIKSFFFLIPKVHVVF